MNMTQDVKPQMSRSAVAAFVLGLSSLALSILTGLPALLVGVWAVRTVNASDGRLRGRGLALIGLIVAACSLLLTVVGVAALVLVVLQDKSQRTECANNLRQVGLAVHKYRDLHDGQFPPGTIANPQLAAEQRLSWQAAILPYLAEGTPAGKKWEKMAGQLARNDAWDAPSNSGPRQTNVPFFLCPVFYRSFADKQTGLTSSVGIAGVGVDAARSPRKDPRAGFFGYDRVLTQADIASGTSATMMVAETTQHNGPWLAGGLPTVRGLDPEVEHYIGLGRPFGGLHQDGLNVLWADGSVRIIADRIAPREFRAMARINREAED
jgi:prepilin-type processing-associated H-X9-DG protein